MVGLQEDIAINEDVDELNEFSAVHVADSGDVCVDEVVDLIEVSVRVASKSANDNAGDIAMLKHRVGGLAAVTPGAQSGSSPFAEHLLATRRPATAWR